MAEYADVKRISGNHLGERPQCKGEPWVLVRKGSARKQLFEFVATLGAEGDRLEEFGIQIEKPAVRLQWVSDYAGLG